MTAPAIPEGFTPHDGNGCPVPLDTIVDVFFASGVISHLQEARYWVIGTENWWSWANESIEEDCKILAYRVSEP